MKIQVGMEYNIRSQHRPRDDESYIFRGIVLSHRHSDVWNVEITAFNAHKGQRPGQEISVSADRFKSLVARTNIEAKSMLSKEW